MLSPSRFKAAPRFRYVYDLLVGLFLRGGGAVASFVVTWLIARQFGAAVVGQYQIGLTTAALGGMVATLGLHLVLVREAGKLMTSQQWGDLAATYRACRKHIFVAGSLGTATLLAATALLAGRIVEDTAIVHYVVIFAPLVVILALLRLNIDLLRSLGDVWKSQSLEGVFYSSLTAIILTIMWLSGVDYSAYLIAAIYVACVTLALVLSAKIVARKLAKFGSGSAQIGATQGITAIAPSVLMLGVDWTILIIVGAFLSLSEAGIYRTLVLYGSLIQMVAVSFTIMASPHLARAKAEDDRKQFFSALESASYLGVAVAALPVLIAVFAPELILNLFGPEFIKGSQAMGILAVAQLIGVAAGPTATALLMLNREKPVLHVEILAAVGSIPLALVLVQNVGLIGPPIAVLAASVVRGAYTRWQLAEAWKPD